LNTEIVRGYGTTGKFGDCCVLDACAGRGPKQEGFLMKNRILTSVAIAGLIALGACSKHDTPAAENVADNYENVADNIEEVADNAATDNAEDALNNKADAVRATGENKADAIDAAASNGSNAM
jgi:hypothetical protein